MTRYMTGQKAIGLASHLAAVQGPCVVSFQSDRMFKQVCDGVRVVPGVLRPRIPGVVGLLVLLPPGPLPPLPSIQRRPRQVGGGAQGLQAGGGQQQRGQLRGGLGAGAADVRRRRGAAADKAADVAAVGATAVFAQQLPVGGRRGRGDGVGG